jgi:hypothetical protein
MTERCSFGRETIMREELFNSGRGPIPLKHRSAGTTTLTRVIFWGKCDACLSGAFVRQSDEPICATIGSNTGSGDCNEDPMVRRLNGI